jgi:ketosteroid isomerase-like protein
MKYAPVMLSICCFCMALSTDAQTPGTEKVIRELEKKQCAAIVQHDTAALFNIWADDFTVNSPTNDVVKLEAAKEAIRKGLIDYSLFDSNLEEIQIFDDVVVTMGNGTIKPMRNAPMAGQTVNRRYTQIWVKRNDEWKLVARHANIIK